ncbi:MAG: DUF559 domain-containing protein [Chlorobi bacterium]|nr:DUF559 domain-containing protein [Chlorobiota bacterium]
MSSKAALKKAVKESNERLGSNFKIWIKRRTLVKRSEQLRNRPPMSQKAATHLVESIACKYFDYHIQKEKILAPYFIDIYIKEIKVGIEIDGGIHNTQETYDNRRDDFLWKTYRVKIYRFSDKEMKNPERFKWYIWEICMHEFLIKLDKIRKKANKCGYKFPIFKNA